MKPSFSPSTRSKGLASPHFTWPVTRNNLSMLARPSPQTMMEAGRRSRRTVDADRSSRTARAVLRHAANLGGGSPPPVSILHVFSILFSSYFGSPPVLFFHVLLEILLHVVQLCCRRRGGVAAPAVPSGCFAGGGNLLWTSQQSWKVKLKLPPPA